MNIPVKIPENIINSIRDIRPLEIKSITNL